ncbi:DUF1207 domain-containing protein [Ignavibacteria bacterium 4148-Me]|jgi:hypothetical protein|uniref:DUF1207 domain-containing protein n=1 Tax=Rosettibacter primus TaxID=3111523 RepID=UPI00336BB453
MKIKLTALLLLILHFQIFSQKKIEIFPDNLTVQPFTANILEPKLGFLFHLSKNELRLDIGNSIDVLRIQHDDETISIGADFFTYTLLRSEKNFHFPVDAVDYLFGINSCYTKKINNNKFGVRFRLSHISAHFVDGHFDGTNNKWRDNLNPRVYSREFIEIMPFYSVHNLRFYGGFTYIFHVDPKFIKKDNYQIGFDYFGNEFFNNHIRPFFAYDLKVVHIIDYSINHSIAAGLKFGKNNGKGLSTYINYYYGKSIHGEYFDINKNYFAFGINLDL